MLRGLEFEPWTAPVVHWQNRMDVACFIGYCRRRASSRLPLSILQWLQREGFIDAPGQPGLDSDALENLPIPIDDWSMFEQLFEVRTLSIEPDNPLRVPSYVSAAVRSFFAQGGRRCIVVPIQHAADLHLRSTVEARRAAIARLIPVLGHDVGDAAAMEPVDRGAWRGLGLLHGLDDVVMLCLPDLPWLVGQVPSWLTAEQPRVVPRSSFYECADGVVLKPDEPTPPPIAIGRCEQAEYRVWAEAVRAISTFLARYRRDLQLVAALPLPLRGSWAERDPIDALIAWGVLERGDDGSGPLSDHGVASRFVQLGYPWIGWRGSRGLPENLEPPDGMLAGILARNALVRGTYHSAAGRAAYDIEQLEPTLSRTQREREPDEIPVSGGPIEGALIKRLSLVGYGLHRFELSSDVTSAGDSAQQLAGVQRLHAVWVRALQQAGPSLLFEPSSEATWDLVRRHLTEVGMALFRGGAFRGESPTQAFRVRCDRTTMSQRDIDGGRLIAEIEYRPVAPLELIRVALALSENREVTVLSETSEVPS